MTHVLPSVKIKELYDEHCERYWLFFREGIAQPLLMLTEFEMQQLATLADSRPKNAIVAGPEPDRQWTDLSCHTPETAAAVFQYLNDEIAQQEERPNIEAHVEKATVRISYINCRDREAWDMQFVGYRDGIESAAAHAAALQAQLDAAQESIALLKEIPVVANDAINQTLNQIQESAIESFRQRAVAAVRARRFNAHQQGNSTYEYDRIIELLQQLSTSTEDGE